MTVPRLKPLDNVHKLLLSSPCYFTGEYAEDDFLLTHAWPLGMAPENWNAIAGRVNPLARSYFVVAFETESLEASENPNPRIIPNYEFFGNQLCAWLGVLYGKRFDNHGLLESNGMFQVPSLLVHGLPPIFQRSLPFNSSTPRVDFPLDLNLANFALIASLLFDQALDQKFRSLLLTAGRYYVRALRLFEEDPELAFLDLVTCGEVLAGYFDFEPSELFDPHLRDVLGAVEGIIPNGPALRSDLEGRLHQIRRRYTRALLKLLTPAFFANTEAIQSSYALAANDVEARLKGSYDLRSRYLHTGVSFGQWMRPTGFLNETQIGKPVVEPDEFGKELERSPTFLGLERIVRFALLRFVHLFGHPIDQRLDGDGLEPKPES